MGLSGSILHESEGIPMKKTFFLLLLSLCLTLFSASCLGEGGPRMPGPAALSQEETERIKAAGDLRATPLLNAALSLLEEGNPFLLRYNAITDSSVQPRLPYGVPYLFGGQAESHVFAKAPDYVVQEAWISSPIYYRAGTKYLYGFDCAGYVKWVWKEAGKGELPKAQAMMWDVAGHVPHAAVGGEPVFENLPMTLLPGDLLVTESHMALYLGTLREFGYTKEEAPELAPYLDWPLVIHSTVHAGVADRFDHLIHHGLEKYRVAEVTDGGVGVSLLGLPTQAAPGHVFQQKQDTWYFVLPDQTWLTILPWHSGQRYCIYR